MQAAGLITFVKTEDGTADLRTLAGRLKWARLQRKLSQTELAKRAGVSQGTIGNLESGGRKDPRRIVEIAGALYCSPSWLSSGKGQWDLAKAGSDTPVAREKGAVYHVPNSEERDMLEIWRRMSPSDRKSMLLEMADKAERYQADMQQSLDEAGVKLPFPLTSPVSAKEVRATAAKASVAPTGQRELPLAERKR